MTVKIADSKGRITLGAQYANATLLMQEQEGGTVIILKRAETVPVNEAWLYRNTDALNMVMRGLEAARKRAFSTSKPDLDAAWIKELSD